MTKRFGQLLTVFMFGTNEENDVTINNPDNCKGIYLVRILVHIFLTSSK